MFFRNFAALNELTVIMMNTTKNLAFRKPLLMIAWLLAMKGAVVAQNLRETFSSPNGKIEWKAEGEKNKVKAFDVAYRNAKSNKSYHIYSCSIYYFCRNWI